MEFEIWRVFQIIQIALKDYMYPPRMREENLTHNGTDEIRDLTDLTITKKSH